MAHEIENNNGKTYAFINGAAAWHNLGKPLQNINDIDEAWNTAYPHNLIELPLQGYVTNDDTADRATVDVDDYKLIIRDDGRQIGVVGKDFKTTQPREILEVFRPLLESGLATLETGMSLRGGRQMVVLAKIKDADADIVKGDQIKGYFLMFTGFDGSLRVGMSQTNTRVVCANTLGQAIGEGIDHRFKHTKNVHVRIDSVKNDVMQALQSYQKDVEAYRYLATKKLARHQQEDYIKTVLITDKERVDNEISGKKETIINNVIELLDTQKGLDLVPAIRGTAWQAYNAVTEYTTHQYGRTDDSRVHAQFFGESAKLNQNALTHALRM